MSDGIVVGSVVRIYSYQGDGVQRAGKVIRIASTGSFVMRRWKRGERGSAIRCYRLDRVSGITVSRGSKARLISGGF